MKRVALITGILGQDGAYLANLLLEKEYKIYGVVRRYTKLKTDNLQYFGIEKHVELIEGDMTDEASLIRIVKVLRPDELYNLAAQSFVGSSWDMPEYTLECNTKGVLHLLEAIRNHSPKTRFYQASTSEMFGNSVDPDGYQRETTVFKPASPYAISKCAAHYLVQNYRESYGLFACSGILFNHESPLRGEQFVTKKIAKGVALIKYGKLDRIELGNMHTCRDWGYAGDYVKAMWLMLQKSKADDYVIATGQTYSVRDFVEKAFAAAGIKEWEKYISINPAYVRPVDVLSLRGDYSKAKKELGWEPSVTFDQLVKMMVEHEVNLLNR